MKANLFWDERTYLILEKRGDGINVKIDEEFYEEYERVNDLYEEMQTKLRKMNNDARGL